MNFKTIPPKQIRKHLQELFNFREEAVNELSTEQDAILDSFYSVITEQNNLLFNVLYSYIRRGETIDFVELYMPPQATSFFSNSILATAYALDKVFQILMTIDEYVNDVLDMESDGDEVVHFLKLFNYYRPKQTNLYYEGIANEVAHTIQTLRKRNEFDVLDFANVFVYCDDFRVEDAILGFHSKIKKRCRLNHFCFMDKDDDMEELSFKIIKVDDQFRALIGTEEPVTIYFKISKSEAPKPPKCTKNLLPKDLKEHFNSLKQETVNDQIS